MTADELARVFDAFEQGEHATAYGSHRFGGLGLGLAISKRLVALHGGNIQATSEGRGRGTTFVVKLIRHLPAAPTQPTTINASTAPSVNDGPGTGLHILLVENHEPTRHALDQLLRRRNYNVACAASLAEARSRAAAGEFDLLVSDVGRDGPTLMAELRDRVGLKALPSPATEWKRMSPGTMPRDSSPI